MISVPYNRAFEVTNGMRATFVDAGHILGSASVLLDCHEDGVKRRLVFSGDIGRWALPIIRDPVIPEGADVVIMESTYGNRAHAPPEDARARLATIIPRMTKFYEEVAEGRVGRSGAAHREAAERGP